MMSDFVFLSLPPECSTLLLFATRERWRQKKKWYRPCAFSFLIYSLIFGHSIIYFNKNILSKVMIILTLTFIGISLHTR